MIPYKDHVVSNASLFHLRYMLFCLQHITPFPRRICEIGTGYGALARLFFSNPADRPECYALIDFPESLFFAEVFLRANLPDLNIAYASAEPIQNAQVVLCPIGYASHLSQFAFDLAINTGSMGEMSEAWVNYWLDWLDSASPHYFYSLNYFAQPVSLAAEGRNDYNQRLSAKWAARALNFDPEFIRLWSPGRHWAEILYKFAATPPPTPSVNWARHMDGQLWLELLDAFRYGMPENDRWLSLERCLKEMPYVPTEAVYLARHMLDSVTYGARAKEILASLESSRSIFIPDMQPVR